MNPITRRRFLATAAAATTAPLILPSRLLGGPTAPSNQVTLGFIGVGHHGVGVNLKNFLFEEGCRAVAVCDCFTTRRQKAKALIDSHYQSKDCLDIPDFRDLLARDDIDAVVISTPDHWHVPLSLLALEAGKDVFCEKPTLTIAQGRQLTEAVTKHNAVFQTGLEDRSVIHYHKIAEAVRNGAIGKLQRIEVGLPHKKTHVFPNEDPAPVPDDLNWEMWLGEAPEAPYSPTRTHKDCWRQMRDYAGGTLTDWGAHLMDTANVGNFAEDTGPVSAEGSGTTPPNALNSIVLDFELDYTYANGVAMNVKTTGPSIRFEGSEGWAQSMGWRGPLEAHDREIFRREYEDNKIWPLPPGEHRDFLDCIQSRQPATYHAEALHRLSTSMHIGNIAIELGRKVHWDPATESFKGDPEADALRSRPARSDWKNAT